MIFKVCLFLIVSIIICEGIQVQHGTVEYETPAEYEFNYSIHDPHTGDIKSQKEVRKGDVVHGYYDLIEPDGYKRIVEYTADKHNGFNAIVRREPTNIKIPTQHYVAPNVHYSAPHVQQHYSAPQVHYAQPQIHYAQQHQIHNYQTGNHYLASQNHYTAPIQHKIRSPLLTKIVVPGGGHGHGHDGASHVAFNAPHFNYQY